MTVWVQLGRGPRPAAGPPDPAAGPPDPAAAIRLFRSGYGSHLFVADGSRIYDVPSDTAARLARWLAHRGESATTDPVSSLWNAVGLDPVDLAQRWVGPDPASPPPLTSISLNVMQACNMSCRYCYADEGRFGGRARGMPSHVARAAVDRLLEESAPGADLVLGFMGGEPLLNRDVVHDATRYAAAAARTAGRRIRFSVTTNLTTVRPEDARLFAQFPFTVCVSLDGDRAGNDAVRRMKDGSSAYDRVRAGLRVVQRHGRPRHLAARVTVTRRTGALLPVLEHVLSLGFDEVGFAAVLASPDPELALSEDDFPMLLDHMVACGQVAQREIAAGRRYPFGNFETAMQQIHRGTHRPYPCGAGAAYLSAGADGTLFACHRLIDDPAFAMGDVGTGSDLTARAEHLARNHVDRMEPCRSCWARYLCGGGCYHEVSRRGRVSCDYVRGWLDFCLQAYVELSTRRPEYFAGTDGAPPLVSDPTTAAR
jgi:uncharacterized protein